MCSRVHISSTHFSVAPRCFRAASPSHEPPSRLFRLDWINRGDRRGQTGRWSSGQVAHGSNGGTEESLHRADTRRQRRGRDRFLKRPPPDVSEAHMWARHARRGVRPSAPPAPDRFRRFAFLCAVSWSGQSTSLSLPISQTKVCVRVFA